MSFMRRVLFYLVITIFVASLGFSIPAQALASQSPSTIPDVSWPNCKENLSNDQATGIVGVGGGLDFHANACLYQESRLFSTYALYLNTGYPGTSYGLKYQNTPINCVNEDNLCLAYNYGYNAARYFIRYASANSVHSYRWWLDVETDNSWTNNIFQNRANLIGMYDAIKQFVPLSRVGFYSYPGQWNEITGNWRTGTDVWSATGTSSLQTAMSGCQHSSFTLGPTLLTQYTTQLDHNYICNPSYLSTIQI
jgi:hypothetical protein